MRVTASSDGAVATIEGIGAASASALVEVLASLAYENAARAVVLDLVDVPALPPLGREESDALAGVALPTIAAWGDRVAGRAFDLGLACDIRVCSSAAVIGAGLIGTRRQVAILGEAGCTRLLEADGRADAALALEIGLVSRVADASRARDMALEVAATIARRGPIATRLAKEAVWRGVAMPLSQALRFETDLTLLLQTTKDRAEGVHAFLEKREPQFTGD